MKSTLIALLIPLASSADARPTDDIVQACLTNESIPQKVEYKSVDFDRVNIEEEPARSLTTTTILSGALVIGKYERSTDSSFGIVYGTTKFPAKQIKRLSQQKPEPFQVELAEYGSARRGTARYTCITFNFEGLGQSGSFQNIRGLYLIDTSAKPMRAYYTVGDIRKYRQQKR